MPEIPISRRRALAYAVAVLVVLIVAGRVLLPAGAPRERGTGADALVVADSKRSGAAAVVVHVVGAVERPGLYRLRDGSRVADAVARAGGATAEADLALINLAAPVADGLQVVVPARAPAAADAGPPSSTAAGAGGTVHLNSATLDQLDALPGIGPVTAQKIIDYREQHGAFRSVDELDAVPGIGAARLEQLRELVAP